MPTTPKSKSEERRLEQQKEDTAGQTGQAGPEVKRDENEPYKDAAEAKEDMKTETAYGERRADGEIEGVTVNSDKYQGPKFDNLKEEYKNSSLAASQAGQLTEKDSGDNK